MSHELAKTKELPINLSPGTHVATRIFLAGRPPELSIRSSKGRGRKFKKHVFIFSCLSLARFLAASGLSATARNRRLEFKAIPGGGV
jgi:hypothetical protein